MSSTGTAPPRQVEILRTRDAAADRRFHEWGSYVSRVCGPLRVGREWQGGFNGHIVTGTFGTVQLAAVRAEPHTVELTRLRAADTTTPRLYLTHVLDGEVHASQGGNVVTAGAGNLFSYDSSHPFVLRMPQPIHMVSVKFDHRLVDLRAGQEHPLRAAFWCGDKGVSVLLASLLRSVANHMTELDTTAADQLGTGIANLVGAVCAEKLGAPGSDFAAVRRSLLHRIKSYARARLADPELSPLELARAHRVSLRYLQLLFQEEDTSPALWIRNERLARCWEDLGSPRLAHLTVATIAERWGLRGASHFSRLFREAYGVTPRDWRRQARDTMR
ncbi:helix-turn-helix domain-containing protein [Streptomyces sp. NBRC 109706]|uniref:AraC-like ligand-binding domain-containing protein n=1 Tax=Streptomyces sp. NBRC 109706 TaxID=1550035 RepID=UPI00099C314E|nr:helix-turn-helix domain-containing protein [Streptomyces sp. NBRC 109706]